MRGRVHAISTLKGLVADLRFILKGQASGQNGKFGHKATLSLLTPHCRRWSREEGWFIIYAKLNKSFHKTKIWAKELSNFLELSEYEALHLASKTPSPHTLSKFYIWQKMSYFTFYPPILLYKRLNLHNERQIWANLFGGNEKECVTLWRVFLVVNLVLVSRRPKLMWISLGFLYARHEHCLTGGSPE